MPDVQQIEDTASEPLSVQDNGPLTQSPFADLMVAAGMVDAPEQPQDDNLPDTGVEEEGLAAEADADTPDPDPRDGDSDDAADLSDPTPETDQVYITTPNGRQIAVSPEAADLYKRESERSRQFQSRADQLQARIDRLEQQAQQSTADPEQDISPADQAQLEQVLSDLSEAEGLKLDGLAPALRTEILNTIREYTQPLLQRVAEVDNYTAPQRIQQRASQDIAPALPQFEGMDWWPEGLSASAPETQQAISGLLVDRVSEVARASKQSPDAIMQSPRYNDLFNMVVREYASSQWKTRGTQSQQGASPAPEPQQKSTSTKRTPAGGSRGRTIPAVGPRGGGAHRSFSAMERAFGDDQRRPT